MSAALTIVGAIALTAGALFIAKSVFARIRDAIQLRAAIPAKRNAGSFAAVDNRRIDTRFGLVLMASGAVLAVPQFLGFAFDPATQTILACMLPLFMTAHSRYARQLRATQPERFNALLSTTALPPPEN